MNCSLMPNILFISNGHGEDRIAASVIREIFHCHSREGGNPDSRPTLRQAPRTVLGLPLVGHGREYEKLKVPLLAQGKDLPSGGFVMTTKELWTDIRAGWLGITLKQWWRLWRFRKQVNVVVAVGDTYALWLSLWCPSAKKIFISTAKSSHVGDHNQFELRKMKQYHCKVFARDALTADYLSRHGIDAEYVGNPMMDMIPMTGETFGARPNDIVIGVLPGSRNEAYQNLELIHRVLADIRKRFHNDSILFVVAVPESLDKDRCAKILEYAEDVVITNQYADAVNASRVVIGLAGTANEQAVGMGKPVVAFPGTGPQTSHYRFRLQRRLLGGGVTLIDQFDPAEIANVVLRLSVDHRWQEKVKAIGLERMGLPGASQRIAEKIDSLIE